MDEVPSKSMYSEDRIVYKRRRRTTLGFIFVVILATTVNQATMVALAEIFSSYSWLFLEISDTTAYTLAGVFYNVGNLLLIVPLTRLSDKIGRRKVLLFSTSFALFALIIIYFAQAVEIVYLGRLLFGMNSYIGVTTALIDDYYPGESRGKPLGYMSAAMLIGFLLGSVLGPIIYEVFKDFTFLFLDGITLLSFLNVIISIHDHPNFAHRKKKNVSTSEKEDLKRLARDPKFIGSLIINFFANLTFLGSGVYWNIIILTYFDVPNNVAGLWFLPPLIADFSTYILVPILFKKRFDKVIFYAVLAGIPASVLLFFEPTIGMFTIAGVVFGILNSAVIQANDTISLSFIPKKNKGTAIGILKFSTNVAAALGPLLFGLLADHVGTFVPLTFFIFMLMIVGFTYWLLVYRNIK